MKISNQSGSKNIIKHSKKHLVLKTKYTEKARIGLTPDFIVKTKHFFADKTSCFIAKRDTFTYSSQTAKQTAAMQKTIEIYNRKFPISLDVGDISADYGHTNNFDVAVGDTVGCGDLLGGVGSTGNSTGNHLHFEIRTGGAWDSSKVNPHNYIIYYHQK